MLVLHVEGRLHLLRSHEQHAGLLRDLLNAFAAAKEMK
jgi:hypothetical protein